MTAIDLQMRIVALRGRSPQTSSDRVENAYLALDDTGEQMGDGVLDGTVDRRDDRIQRDEGGLWKKRWSGEDSGTCCICRTCRNGSVGCGRGASLAGLGSLYGGEKEQRHLSGASGGVKGEKREKKREEARRVKELAMREKK